MRESTLKGAGNRACSLCWPSPFTEGTCSGETLLVAPGVGGGNGYCEGPGPISGETRDGEELEPLALSPLLGRLLHDPVRERAEAPEGRRPLFLTSRLYRHMYP